ncbi:DUF805 domain-containing protein [Phenylobacterium sp.]|uniref:DUF805 domain-containing protein n=1 Tax=Phenylobacterium sp. TaxID=1871053 RepID=UPI003BAD9C3C
MNADWGALFFTADGRLARTPFLIGAAVLIVLGAIYEAVAGVTLHWLTGWFVYPALIYGGACVLSKRLHDRGKSGWWAAVILFALVAVWQPPLNPADVLLTVLLLWATVELGVMPGEQGTNRYGANPLRTVAA